MPSSSTRAPVRSMDVRWVVAWRAKASWAICRTRTCSRESFVGRRKSYVRGSLRRARDPRGCDQGPPATAPVSGRGTSTPPGGGGGPPHALSCGAGGGRGGGWGPGTPPAAEGGVGGGRDAPLRGGRG